MVRRLPAARLANTEYYGELLAAAARSSYLGEPVSLTEHMLQSASAAEQGQVEELRGEPSLLCDRQVRRARDRDVSAGDRGHGHAVRPSCRPE